MTMIADPTAGALAYFSAALRLDFQKLIVDPMSRSSGEKFKIYDTKVAEKHFNPNTGRIGCCKEHQRCDTFMANWFFCHVNHKTDNWENSFLRILYL